MTKSADKAAAEEARFHTYRTHRIPWYVRAIEHTALIHERPVSPIQAHTASTISYAFAQQSEDCQVSRAPLQANPTAPDEPG